MRRRTRSCIDITPRSRGFVLLALVRRCAGLRRRVGRRGDQPRAPPLAAPCRRRPAGEMRDWWSFGDGAFFAVTACFGILKPAPLQL